MFYPVRFASSGERSASLWHLGLVVGLILSAAAILYFTARFAYAERDRAHAEIDALDPNTAEIDAKTAALRKDWRPHALYKFYRKSGEAPELEYPGVSRERAVFCNEENCRVLKWTERRGLGGADLEQHRRAYEYLLRYNTELMKQIAADQPR